MEWNEIYLFILRKRKQIITHLTAAVEGCGGAGAESPLSRWFC